jgi:hypothetical protein
LSKQAFPDINPCYHNFRVDLWEHNRVWFTTAGYATFTGKLTAFNAEPTGKRVEMTHQTNSLTFNEEGQVTKYTIGYPMDKELGNTGGLGEQNILILYTQYTRLRCSSNTATSCFHESMYYNGVLACNAVVCFVPCCPNAFSVSNYSIHM